MAEQARRADDRRQSGTAKLPKKVVAPKAGKLPKKIEVKGAKRAGRPKKVS